MLLPSPLVPVTLLPPTNDLPTPPSPPPTDPPLRRSTRLHFPYSRAATLDGLLPNPHTAAAISDSLLAPLHDAAILVRKDGDGHVMAFLAEFVPFCDSHCLLPLDVPTSDYTSVPEILAAVTNGLLEPEVDIDDDPLWSEAMASPEKEYWIAGA